MKSSWLNVANPSTASPSSFFTSATCARCVVQRFVGVFVCFRNQNIGKHCEYTRTGTLDWVGKDYKQSHPFSHTARPCTRYTRDFMAPGHMTIRDHVFLIMIIMCNARAAPQIDFRFLTLAQGKRSRERDSSLSPGQAFCCGRIFYGLPRHNCIPFVVFCLPFVFDRFLQLRPPFCDLVLVLGRFFKPFCSALNSFQDEHCKCSRFLCGIRGIHSFFFCFFPDFCFLALF